jgi:hypothetical protein
MEFPSTTQDSALSLPAALGCAGCAESPPILRTRLRAGVRRFLARVSGAGCGLGFHRVAVIRIREFFSRSSRAWQPAIAPFLDSELEPAGATTLRWAEQ